MYKQGGKEARWQREHRSKPALREEARSPSSQELQQELTSCCDARHGDPTEQAACFYSPCCSILVFSCIGLSAFLPLPFLRCIDTLSVRSSQHLSLSLSCLGPPNRRHLKLPTFCRNTFQSVAIFSKTKNKKHFFSLKIVSFFCFNKNNNYALVVKFQTY